MVEDGCLRVGRRYWRIIANPDNEPVAAAHERYPDRFIPFVFVNPNQPSHTDVIDHYLSRGFRGVKVNAWLHEVDLRQTMRGIARRCGEAGFPILIHLGGSHRTGLAILELVDRYPTTDFIVAHAGLPCYSWLWRAARIHPNLYFDLAAPHMTAELLRQAAARIPPGRLLFASGCPHGLRVAGGGHSYVDVRRRMDVFEVSGEARWAILGGTVSRLVGLPTDRLPAAAENPYDQYSSRFGR